MLEASLNHLESIVSKGRDAGATSDGISPQSQDGVALRMEGSRLLYDSLRYARAWRASPPLEKLSRTGRSL
jgi:hypothetical protein